MHLPTALNAKRQCAISLLREHRAVLVALSGGVDSAVLLAIAAEALGSANVLAVTGRSASVTEQEIQDAVRVARTIGVRHEVVATLEIERPAYRANAGDRCFHCRTELFELLGGIARTRGLDAIAFGAIVDDLGDDRPGMTAAREMGVLAPLLHAHISKNDVRALAAQFDLHIQDKPANACLASRIPRGVEVTPERLMQVSRAEAALRGLGFRRFRVRHHGEVARIELGKGEVGGLTDPRVRVDVIRSVKEAGFRFVALDLEEYGAARLDPEAAVAPLYSIGPHRDSGQ
jgi:pyridinium-3,5-biscarboxylic acid mononucleotide sulfurtransferase